MPPRTADGTIQAQAHEDEGVAPSGLLCTTSYHWAAVVQQFTVRIPSPGSPEWQTIPRL
jgi:hypothetical protein